VKVPPALPSPIHLIVNSPVLSNAWPFWLVLMLRHQGAWLACGIREHGSVSRPWVNVRPMGCYVILMFTFGTSFQQ
jgi:hypothetical protein